jgi:glycosyltransferase involved in cell wall biosynthesis
MGEPQPDHTRKSRLLGRLKRFTPRPLFELIEIAYTGYAFLRTLYALQSFRPDFVYDRYVTFNAGVVLAGRLSGTPVCLEVNAPLAMERSVQQDERLTFRRTAAWMERWICSHATRTVVVSTPLKHHLESTGVPADKCVVMPNGVDTVRFSPRPKDCSLQAALRIPEKAFIIGFTGILRPWHGLDLLLDAVAGVIDAGLQVALLIVGDGPHRRALEERARSLGIAHAVFITGRVTHERVPDFVSLFDVAVSPRATFYASPMKVLEYMALGKAVVVPATPNFFDIIEDCQEGIAFEDGSVTALGQALVRLLNEPALCKKLASRAREKTERRLNWAWNAREVVRLFSPGQPCLSPSASS